MAPLSREVRPVVSLSPPHLGPAVPEVNSLWFKLFLYHMTGYGPPSLLLKKGTELKQLPRLFLGFSRLLVTSWLHEPAVIPISNILYVNAALQFSPVLIQAYGVHQPAQIHIIPFPITNNSTTTTTNSVNNIDTPTDLLFKNHPVIKCLSEFIDIEHNCGYLTFTNIGVLDFGCRNNKERTVRLGGRNLTNKLHGSSGMAKKSNDNNNEPTSISNENFSFTKNENKLQSPVESHFALTPTTTNSSESSSPANGFTSKEGADLLEEELHQLEEQQESNNSKLELNLLHSSPSIETLTSPMDENISMFSVEEKQPTELKKNETEDRAEVSNLLFFNDL